jgi:hypothetical protein
VTPARRLAVLNRALWRRPTFAAGLVPNLAATSLLQHFLIAAIASVLTVRALLAATGYPQIAGGGLHVAHMLWGGLLMVTAVILLLAFVGPAAARLASIVGGLGFGLFIDELGKFITSDNNYFFHPTIALIYLVFLVLFVLFRRLEHPRHIGPSVYLLNVLNLIGEKSSPELDWQQWRQAQDLLSKCDPANPLVQAARLLLANPPAEPVDRPSRAARTLRRLKDFYQRIVGSRWFRRLVVGLFLLNAAGLLLLVIALAGQALGFGSGGPPDFSGWPGFAASLVSASMVVIGASRLRRPGVEALLWFRRAVLVSLFAVDIFAFYQSELAALSDFGWDLLLLLLLDSMIRYQRQLSNSRIAVAAPASA